MTNTENTPKPLTASQVAELTGLKKSTIYQLIYKREIPFFKFGPRSVRFWEADILAWMEARTHKPLAEAVKERQAERKNA